jgi:hypothetical protein
MWLSVEEMAKLKGQHQGTIRHQIRYMQCDAVRIGSEWRIWVANAPISASAKTKRSLSKIAYHARASQ